MDITWVKTGMPGSTRHGKDIIKNWVQSKPIESIVDIGCGSGTYRKLLGDKYRWIGVDIWGPYIDKFGLNKLYDKVVIAQADIIDWRKLQADLIIFGDVLEHMERQTALEVVHGASVYYPHMVVSLPISEMNKFKSKEHYGNTHEKHISFWSYEEFGWLYPWEKMYRDHNIGIYMI